jgi:hypothetical protein
VGSDDRIRELAHRAALQEPSGGFVKARSGELMSLMGRVVRVLTLHYSSSSLASVSRRSALEMGGRSSKVSSASNPANGRARSLALGCRFEGLPRSS